MPTMEHEVAVDVSADDMWKTLKEQNELLPKICPREIESIEVVEGDGGPGTVRLIKYGAVAPAGMYVKERVVRVDPENRCVVTEEVEGGHLGQFGFEKYVQTLKVIPTGSDTSKVQICVDREGGTEEAAQRSDEMSKEGLTGKFKALANSIKEKLKPNV